MVDSDFRNNRVDDPKKISAKQEKQVKRWVSDYFDKAVVKKRQHDAKKAERRKQKENGTHASPSTPLANGPVLKESPASDLEGDGEAEAEAEDDDDDDVAMELDDEVEGNGDAHMQDPDDSPTGEVPGQGQGDGLSAIVAQPLQPGT